MLIATRAISATNTRGKRISASTVDDNNVSRSIGWDHSLNMDQNHEDAARALLDVLGLGHMFVTLQATKSGVRYFSVDGSN